MPIGSHLDDFQKPLIWCLKEFFSGGQNKILKVYLIYFFQAPANHAII